MGESISRGVRHHIVGSEKKSGSKITRFVSEAMALFKVLL